LQKRPTTLSNFPKKGHQHYRTFLKLSGNVIDLFKKSLFEFPAFPEKKRRHKTYHSMPDRPKDFAGLSGKWPAKLSDFLKIVRKSHRSFQKKSGNIIDLSEKSLPKFPNFPEDV